MRIIFKKDIERYELKSKDEGVVLLMGFIGSFKNSFSFKVITTYPPIADIITQDEQTGQTIIVKGRLRRFNILRVMNIFTKHVHQPYWYKYKIDVVVQLEEIQREDVSCLTYEEVEDRNLKR